MRRSIPVILAILFSATACQISGPQWKLSKILVKNTLNGSHVYFKLTYDSSGILSSIIEQNLNETNQPKREFRLFYSDRLLDSISIHKPGTGQQLGYLTFIKNGNEERIRHYYLIHSDSSPSQAYLELDIIVQKSESSDTIFRNYQSFSDTGILIRATKGLRYGRQGSAENYYFAYGNSDIIQNPFLTELPASLIHVFPDWLPFSIIDRQAPKLVTEKVNDRWVSNMKYDIREGKVFKMETEFDSFMNRGTIGNDLFLNENNLNSSVIYSYISE